MKKSICMELLGVAVTAAGAVLARGSRVLGGILIIGGLLLFFGGWVSWAKQDGGVVCPNCGARIYGGPHPRNLADKNENGYIPCPDCGALVCVDHSNL